MPKFKVKMQYKVTQDDRDFRTDGYVIVETEQDECAEQLAKDKARFKLEAKGVEIHSLLITDVIKIPDTEVTEEEHEELKNERNQ